MSQVLDEKSVGPVEVKSEVVMTLQPAQIMGDLARAVYEQQSVRQDVRDALAKFEYKSITKSELGPLVGMNQEEMIQLDMFWDPAFNKGWIYLADEMVRAQMTNEKGSDAVTHFNKRVLTSKDYIIGVDYKLISYDDPLIELYHKSRPPNLADGTKPKKITNKLYYAVTGETYKDLLSRASTDGGKAARLLFRKVETAARLMYDYINALHAITAQKRIEEEKTGRLEAESRAITLEKEKRGLKEYPQEWFYIATCDLMAMSRAYKFGIITKSNTPEKRISAYECGYLEHIALDFVYIIKTNNAKAIEDAFRATVHTYLKDTHKDVVLLTFSVCKLIANALAACTGGNIATLLEMEKNFPQMMAEPKPVYLTGGGIPKFEGGDEITVKPTESCPKCEKKYINKKALSTHALNCTGPKPVKIVKPRRSARIEVKRIAEEQKANESTQLTIELVVK